MLYNLFTVATGKLCPSGWHVSTVDDWIVLENFLINNGYKCAGYYDNAIVKSLASTRYWSPSTMQSCAISNRVGCGSIANKTGFAVLPGGYINSETGLFLGLNGTGLWWTSTGLTITEAYLRQ